MPRYIETLRTPPPAPAELPIVTAARGTTFVTPRAAVQRVAGEEDAVVLFRWGESAENLAGFGYSADHDSRGRQACNWGPMAGFVCPHPALGPRGLAGAAERAAQMQRRFYPRDPARDGESVHTSISLLKRHGDTLFEPLLAKGVVQLKGDPEVRLTGVADQVSPQLIVGIACNATQTVFLEYAAWCSLESGSWQLYARDIFVTPRPVPERQVFTLEPFAFTPEFLPGYREKECASIVAALQPPPCDGRDPASKAVLTQLAALTEGWTSQWERLLPKIYGDRASLPPLQDGHPPSDVRPLVALRALEPSTDPTTRYRDAVIANPSLFAVWPKMPPEPEIARGYERLADRFLFGVDANREPGNEPGRPPALFARCAGHRRRLQSLVDRSLSLEMTRQLPEHALPVLEAPNDCAITHAVIRAVNADTVVKRLIFTDEAGRIEVQCDPRSVTVAVPGQALREIGVCHPDEGGPATVRYDQLLALIQELDGQYAVTLHAGWVSEMCLRAMSSSEFRGWAKEKQRQEGNKRVRFTDSTWYRDRLERNGKRDAGAGTTDAATLRSLIGDVFAWPAGGYERDLLPLLTAFADLVALPMHTADVDTQIDSLLPVNVK